ncbi:flippase-like domain-containing protein [Rhizobium leguminosarum]|nr:lysylphosphatidylglycerol synthase transmembrane domain-containing protein [Rhizobium leguminosarum]MBY5313756.1 flippase-like domain-containing protein [Rhizobium leguminosarum]MBY5399659.1 flippase-like domain-containing protein [Rhizobium leguminosarum]NEH48569.1 flippase-like domain-containing protein [Rhizobium leguminosarum]
MLIASAISIVLLIFLLRAVDWEEAIRIFRGGISFASLLWFLLVTFGIAVGYAVRWRLLLDGKISYGTSLMASLLGLGANMFLPARGGDLLRVHYSRVVATVPYVDAFGRLLVEKVVDLATIISVGIFSLVLLGHTLNSEYRNVLLVIMIGAVLGIFLSAILVRYFGDQLIPILRPVFAVVRLQDFFERHITNFIRNSARSLSISVTIVPAALTLILWLSAYALAYIFVARFVGVALSYQESLFVLFAGGLGLMIPAAPSGVGTFHASVVSAFVLLGRSPSEGLLLATAVHFLFFVVYVVPAALILGHWRLNRLAPR